MKGYKTIASAVAIALLGILQSPEFSKAIGGCIFDVNASQPDSCAFPWYVVSGIALLMFALRFITTSPIFKGK